MRLVQLGGDLIAAPFYGTFIDRSAPRFHAKHMPAKHWQHTGHRPLLAQSPACLSCASLTPAMSGRATSRLSYSFAIGEERTCGPEDPRGRMLAREREREASESASPCGSQVPNWRACYAAPGARGSRICRRRALVLYRPCWTALPTRPLHPLPGRMTRWSANPCSFSGRR